MRATSHSLVRVWFALAMPVLIAACAPAPLYKTSGTTSVVATPTRVASSPQRLRGREVVWGGSVVAVHNLAHHTEIEILAYPLDSSQRPRLKEHSTGRFIAIVPGFVDPLNYPTGAPVTLRGTLDGSRTGAMGEADYTFALVHSDSLHRWTAAEMRQGHPNIRFGVGVGVGGRIR